MIYPRQQAVQAGLRTREQSLFRDRNFTLLWLSIMTSGIGDWTARIALSLLIYQQTGSARLAAVGFLLASLPAVAGGQLGMIADRFGRRVSTVVSDIVQGFIFVLIVAAELPIALLFVAIVIAGAGELVSNASRLALVGDVEVQGRHRAGRINNKVGADQAVLQIIALGLGGTIVALFGHQLALALNVVTFGVSALLVFGMRVSERREYLPFTTRNLLGAGIIDIWRDKWLRLMFVASVFMGGANAVEAIIPIVADQISRDFGVPLGLQVAMVPLGTWITIRAYGRLSKERLADTGAKTLTLAVISMLVIGYSGYVLLALAPMPGYRFLPAFLLLGVTFAFMIPARGYVLDHFGQRAASVLGTLAAMFTLVTSVTVLITGYLADLTSPLTASIAISSVCGAGALLTLALALGTREETTLE